MVRSLLISILLIYHFYAEANSCCGQSPASFPVLALEQKISINTSYSFSQAEGRIYSPHEFVVWNSKERNVQALQLSVAGTFRSRHQFYVNSSVLNSQYKDAYQNASEQNLSDTQAGYTYEVWPEYSYSLWRPVVLASLLANLPTGKSIYDNVRLSEGTDVTGHNQWGLGIGLTARKVYFPLTFILQGKSLQIFKKQFADVEVGTFYDSSLALLMNYATTWSALSVNLGVTTNHLSSRTLGSGLKSETMQNTSLLLGLQKTLNDAWNMGLNYSDQTLLGPAKNSILNKTVTVNLNYNYY